MAPISSLVSKGQSQSVCTGSRSLCLLLSTVTRGFRTYLIGSTHGEWNSPICAVIGCWSSSAPVRCPGNKWGSRKEVRVLTMVTATIWANKTPGNPGDPGGSKSLFQRKERRKLSK
ncbi:predicted protein [Histoplasma capsulatum H143]|uniref:Uncharacterized protein n=1 Tax=Ajellomyces capsulatus (strain H143) TaxID=544712 RepID=C6HFD5_AJECH|nr:predicted protein [Histoplasma capsulatum H143]